MKNIADLAGLIREYGPIFYGAETPEYVASQWAQAIPSADLATIHGWLDWGFWNPKVAHELSSAGVFPWEVPADTIYDLCNGDLEVSMFLRERA